MVLRLFAGLVFLLWGFTASSEGTAQDIKLSSTEEKSVSDATLISEHARVAPGQTIWLGFNIRPDKGWHTYWENAGDSGLGSTFTWDLPDGAIPGKLYYGIPSRLPFEPLMNYGFKGDTTLLVPIDVPVNASGIFPVQADVEWLVCEQECIPQFGSFQLNIPVGEPELNTQAASIFSDARAQLPSPDLYDADLTVDTNYSLLTINMSDAAIADIANAYFFPLSEGVTEYAANQVVQISDRGLTIRMNRYGGDAIPEMGDGLLKIFKPDGSIFATTLMSVPVTQASLLAQRTTGTANPKEVMSWWLAAIYAFIGGLILNLMPCVFPVLSLKAFALMQAGGLSQRERIAEGWSYTAGIVASFAVIVGVLFALRAGGAAVGWAFQLQDPTFLAFMVVVMLLVGLSMSGFFEIITGLEGSGQGLAATGGNKGAFFTGVLATLVATPCTAPFMAPALGFAITQPISIASIVFLMLALGLAFPFLLLSYSPRLAAMLPRPGAWMETLKQFLAFPLYLTAAWLLWVFTSVAGPDAMFQLVATLIGVVMAIWLYQQSGKYLWRGISAGVLLVSLAYAYDATLDPAPAKSAVSADTTAYTQDVLDAAVGGDQAVFAYFTADWCITCKVNEKTALFRDETKQLFADKNIKLIKGDWTNKNAEIASLLAKYQRAGVPLYLYFPAGQREPVILPEVLSVSIIREALNT